VKTNSEPVIVGEPVYSEADHSVWRELFHRQSKFVRRHACAEYLDGLAKLRLPSDQLCPVGALNTRMQAFSRWRFRPSEGLAGLRLFFDLISQSEFPVSTSMRRPEEIEFSELPDLFHDVFGHAPMLANDSIANIYGLFGAAAARHLDEPNFLTDLGKLLWVSCEVGLVWQQGEIKAFGGAIMSSRQEAENAFRESASIEAFDLQKILSMDYDVLKLQKNYFAFESMSAFAEALLDLESLH
jgi:phenylalanine-4-hydroxylase